MGYPKLDDATLLRLIADGRSDALGELYDRYSRLVFGIALNGQGDRAAAEEVTQDVFLRVWQTEMRVVALAGAGAAPQASGLVVASADGMHGTLIVDDLPELVSQQYQLWLIRDGRWISGGTFSLVEGEYERVEIAAPESLLNFSGFCVTVEPFGGSPAPTGGVVLYGSR